MKRLLFIYNPHAGKELLKPKLADVRHIREQMLLISL